MNKTKKLTQGAMMLAIFGAFSMINKAVGEFLDIFVVLMPAVMIIMYSTMHTFKDGIYLSVGTMILTFIICGAVPYYLTSVPVSIITGLAYSYALRKEYSKTKLLLIAVITFILGEFLAECVILPILGQDLNLGAEAIDEVLNMFKGVTGRNEAFNFEQLANAFKANSKSIIIVGIIVYVIIMGVSQGFIIHVISLALLKKFKIKDVANGGSIIKVKPNKPLSYVCMLITMVSLVMPNYLNIDDNFTIYMIVSVLSTFSLIVLWFYGYIFVVTYMRAVLKIRVGVLFLFIIIMFASSLLIIIGFLYGAGPLQNLLERKMRENNNE